jgi:hypothetical protein
MISFILNMSTRKCILTVKYVAAEPFSRLKMKLFCHMFFAPDLSRSVTRIKLSDGPGLFKKGLDKTRRGDIMKYIKRFKYSHQLIHILIGRKNEVQSRFTGFF